MERDYKQGKVDSATFFIGKEIEHTKFYGMNTLFVVGIQKGTTIRRLADEHNIKHIFLGANHSEFSFIQAEDLVDVGYYVTIDADYEHAIPMNHERYQLIVRYPLDEWMIRENTHLKFYEESQSRKGIYVIPSKLIEEEQYFTDNSEYGDDIIIDED